MKKLFVIAGSLVVVGALAFAGITYAQTPEPPATCRPVLRLRFIQRRSIRSDRSKTR